MPKTGVSPVLVNPSTTENGWPTHSTGGTNPKAARVPERRIMTGPLVTGPELRGTPEFTSCPCTVVVNSAEPALSAVAVHVKTSCAPPATEIGIGGKGPDPTKTDPDPATVNGVAGTETCAASASPMFEMSTATTNVCPSQTGRDAMTETVADNAAGRWTNMHAVAVAETGPAAHTVPPTIVVVKHTRPGPTAE
jgi:hypothetical protein